MNVYARMLIWVLIIGGLFAYLWWTGQLVRLRTYVEETIEELKKCSRPTWAELKGSTVVVLISISLLGLFTMLCDAVFVLTVNWIGKLG